MRVLLVEDERSMVQSLTRGLEAEGYVVDAAYDGEDGLWRAVEFDYDAVVLDIMLPKLNGFTVAARLREAGSDVPILMLTAKDGELDEAEALDAGADDFLSKPFSYTVLLARLRALVRRRGAQRRSVIAAGDLAADLRAHRCWRGDVELLLTPREFAVFAYLLHHPGEVVSKRGLLRHVWSDDESVSVNAVEVVIGYLRRKIDTPFGRHAIETVRGGGYRLAVDGG
jgi:DNA-binding response OmpR family regulator